MPDRSYTPESGHPELEKLEQETVIRHRYEHGEQAGEVAKAKLRDGYIIYNNQRFSPSGAARKANSDISGSEYEINGWTWWKFFNQEKEQWMSLDTLRTES
jgi:hypothetical protein